MSASIKIPKINLRELSSQVKGLVLRESAEDDFTGIPYSDPDAVGANPVATLYPDGTIIGSTDNGEYIKYADGTLICTGSKSITTSISVSFSGSFISTSQSFSYPLVFVDTPTPTVFGRPSGRLCWIMSDSFNSSAVAFYLTSPTSQASATGTFSYMATGRWK